MSGRIEDLTERSENYRYARVGLDVLAGKESHGVLFARLLKIPANTVLDEVRKAVLAADNLAGAGFLVRIGGPQVLFCDWSSSLKIPSKDLSPEQVEAIKARDLAALSKLYPEEEFIKEISF